MSNGRPRAALTVACTLGGAALFAYVVRRAGVADIIDGIQRVGWGLAAILALQGVRFALRTACWRLCMPPHAPLTFRRAFGAFLAGDAIGTVTPLGLLASEPTKIFLTRHHLATRDSVASLAVENLIYAASVGAMVAIGLLVVLATVPLPLVWRWGLVAALCAVTFAVLWMPYVLRRSWNRPGNVRSPWRERLAGLRMAVVGFSEAHRGRLWRAFGLDAVFHTVAVLEVFLTLQWLLGDQSPTMVQAVIFESLNRAVTVAFKFVPFRIGVDEALTGAVAPLLAIAPGAGVALAVVRKVRNLFWSGVGLVIIAVHPAEAAPGTDRPGTADARRS
ncbi:MAG: lysylphosphatidylglycerol synthase transmembrane domain-containing protein [Vicinamibacterales bacterium]